MTAEDAFLIDILAHPDESAPRLIYADWLEDQGDPRSAWVRKGCELLASPAGSPERNRARENFRVELFREGVTLPEVDGLLLTWDNVLSVFRYRLAETITWCSGRGLPFRSDEVDPGDSFLHFLAGRSSEVVSDASLDWERMAQRVTVRRGQALAAQEKTPRWLAEDLAGGRILLYLPAAAFARGPEERQARRSQRRRRRQARAEGRSPDAAEYLDERHLPGWDTWLAYAREPPPEAHHAPAEGYLLAWVPPHLIADVQERMNLQEPPCLLWAEGLDRPFLRRLRDAGLIG
jgi:uncharacterized protein (TIGR02996 family)